MEKHIYLNEQRKLEAEPKLADYDDVNDYIHGRRIENRMHKPILTTNSTQLTLGTWKVKATYCTTKNKENG